MSDLSSLQRAAVIRLQGQFRAAANTDGPLRCVLIHKEGEGFRLPLVPPRSEDMPAIAMRWSSLYSRRLYCRNSNGEEVLCKTPTIGTGRNPYLELDEPVSRSEPFAGRGIYLLRNHKDAMPSWPIDPKVLHADPAWQELSRLTAESRKVFRRLASEVGRCFGMDDCGMLPEVASESLDASDDGDRWLWIVFDLAWRKVRGSPLQAKRSIWHEAENGDQHFYVWDTEDFAQTWERNSRPTTDPDEAKRMEQFAYLQAWAERRPCFYYSSLDDLFSASVWAIDLLLLHKTDMLVEPNKKGKTVKRPKVTTEQRKLLLLAALMAHHKVGTQRPNFEPASYKELQKAFGWGQTMVSRAMETLFGSGPAGRYKAMCKTDTVEGFLKKQDGGSTDVEAISDEEE